jgi:hypothetical protein
MAREAGGERAEVMAGVQRVGLPGGMIAAGSSGEGGGLRGSVLEVLVSAGREGSPLGLACLALAGRVDNSKADTAAGLASLVRQLDESLAGALKGAERVGDPIDELRRRREAKRV